MLHVPGIQVSVIQQATCLFQQLGPHFSPVIYHLLLRCMFTLTWARQLQMCAICKDVHFLKLCTVSACSHLNHFVRCNLVCYILNHMVLNLSMCSPKWAGDQNIVTHYSQSNCAESFALPCFIPRVAGFPTLACGSALVVRRSIGKASN